MVRTPENAHVDAKRDPGDRLEIIDNIFSVYEKEHNPGAQQNPLSYAQQPFH